MLRIFTPPPFTWLKSLNYASDFEELWSSLGEGLVGPGNTSPAQP